MKIRHVIIIAGAILTASFTAHGQGKLVQLGVKGGISTQNVKFTGASKVDGEHGFGANSRPGFHLGVMSRINLPMLHLQPELYYSQTTYRLGISYPVSTGGTGSYITDRSRVRLKSVDVPVLAGMKLMWLHVQAGPMFTILSETKMRDRGYVQDAAISRPSVSYLLGAGVDIKNLTLDVRFNGNFKKYTQAIQYGGNAASTEFRTRHRYWLFSVGYFF